MVMVIRDDGAEGEEPERHALLEHEVAGEQKRPVGALHVGAKGDDHHSAIAARIGRELEHGAGLRREVAGQQCLHRGGAGLELDRRVVILGPELPVLPRSPEFHRVEVGTTGASFFVAIFSFRDSGA